MMNVKPIDFLKVNSDDGIEIAPLNFPAKIVRLKIVPITQTQKGFQSESTDDTPSAESAPRPQLQKKFQTDGKESKKMFRKFLEFTNRYKIVRGMLSYGTLWPCGCLIEQTIIEKRSFRNYDWMKCLKFSLFGGLFMGPTIYMWIRLAGVMWPRTDIKSSLCKAITEQAAYDPFAISTFLFVMSLLDGRTYEQAKQEVSDKFFEAYRVGVIYWPCVQTVNFAFIPPRNQVVFTSFFSMCWTTFLTYIKYLQGQAIEFEHPDIHIHFTH